MTKWITGILAALAAVVAWVFRGFLAKRAEEKLTAQRDAALMDAEGEKIKATAKAQETEALHRQQKNEDAIHAADSAGVASRLDDLFK